MPEGGCHLRSLGSKIIDGFTNAGWGTRLQDNASMAILEENRDRMDRINRITKWRIKN